MAIVNPRRMHSKGYSSLSVGLRIAHVIGASQNEPHTNQYYEKIAVLMYVPIRRPRVHHTCACVTCSPRARAVNIATHVNQQRHRDRQRQTRLASSPGSGDEANDRLAAKMLKEWRRTLDTL